MKYIKVDARDAQRYRAKKAHEAELMEFKHQRANDMKTNYGLEGVFDIPKYAVAFFRHPFTHKAFFIDSHHEAREYESLGYKVVYLVNTEEK